MKSTLYRLLAALIAAATLAGCGAIVQESAMEWMQRQPSRIDGPP
jgi:outer membrane PBP1 activator LpoA protein